MDGKSSDRGADQTALGPITPKYTKAALNSGTYVDRF